ncbi:MAG: GntR family transcriptional regulator [Christensenellales bacterium]|jgi:DNA-binding GntR family transcriptional regulator
MDRDRESLKEKAYRIIKDKIISVEYEPNEFLDENSLIEEIGASRTPIREALNKLEQENLVRIIPKRGIAVSAIPFSELSEIYEVRMMLETMTLRKSIKEMSKDDRFKTAALKYEVLTKGSDSEQLVIDESIHRLFIEYCNNRYLRQVLERVGDQSARVNVIAGRRIHNRMRHTHTEHLNIARAIIAGDEEAAFAALSEHISNSHKAATECFSLTDIDIFE